MKCTERNQEVAAYAANELPRDRARDLAAHLESCSACRETLRQLQEQRGRLEELGAQPAPRGLSHEVRSAVLKAIPSTPRPLNRRLVWSATSLAALAAVLLIVLFLPPAQPEVPVPPVADLVTAPQPAVPPAPEEPSLVTEEPAADEDPLLACVVLTTDSPDVIVVLLK